VTVGHPPGSRLPLLPARPVVTFPAAEHHRPLAGTNLYCLVTEAHRCEQLAQGCYAALPRVGFDLLIASATLYPLHYRATFGHSSKSVKDFTARQHSVSTVLSLVTDSCQCALFAALCILCRRSAIHAAESLCTYVDSTRQHALIFPPA